MAIIYSYPQGTPTLADNVIGSQIDPITEENKTVQFTVGQIAGFANSYSLGYTVYTASLTQTGTAAPVATIMQNTTGKTFTWARTGAGLYTVTANNATFTANKTILLLSSSRAGDVLSGVVTNTTVATLNQGSAAGGNTDTMTGSTIEIRIYA